MITFVWRHGAAAIVWRQVAEEGILDDWLERSRRPGGENQSMLQATDQHERSQVERLTVGTFNNIARYLNEPYEIVQQIKQKQTNKRNKKNKIFHSL